MKLHRIKRFLIVFICSLMVLGTATLSGLAEELSNDPTTTVETSTSPTTTVNETQQSAGTAEQNQQTEEPATTIDASAATETSDTTNEAPSLQYRTHIRNIGWEDGDRWRHQGETSGTTGRALPLECIQVKIENASDMGDVEYRTQIQDIGWESTWKRNGEDSGTTGQNKHLEAIQIRLTGQLAENYDIYYRTYISNYGWLDWTSNGDYAGSEGLGIPMEAIEIQLVKKGDPAPGQTGTSFHCSNWKIQTTQEAETTQVWVKPYRLEQIEKSNLATSVVLSATMTYNGNVTRQTQKEYRLSEVQDKGFLLDAGTYGKFTITAQYKKNGSVVGNSSDNIGVAASEYNLAPLSATLPVVYYTLSQWDINVSKDTGKAVPSIVMLDRPSAYNWDKLPQGVYGMPYLTMDQIKETADYNAFTQYVKDLYQINPQAKFNLYINDITCSLIHSMIYANRIPENQYSITMISDGSATYNIMNDAYGGSDPEAKHQEYLDLWNAGKTEAYQTGSPSATWAPFHAHWECMYAALCSEPNMEWWVARNDLFTSGDDNAFAQKMKNDVKRVNISALLTNLQNKGDATVAEFKTLYNFNDSYFSKAEAEGKKVMMLLGTYVFNEENFSDYARLTSLYYGDDYMYYYKGHPRTPTGSYPDKQKQLNDLGITDVDSAIAAELILFFNPEISISGYGSSTFNSATDDMACGLFSQRKAAALSGSSGVNYAGIDWFASLINRATDDSKIVSLCDEGHTCYLVEFSDSILKEGKYSFGIYDATFGSLRFYKEDAVGNPVLVETKSENGNVIYSSHVSDIGWMNSVKEGQASGTEGQSKALEAFKIELGDLGCSGSIEYQAHVSNEGWQGTDWKKNKEIAGTTGEAKQVEAMRVRLTGEAEKQYDVYYQMHVSNYGWLDWAKNGEVAGTEGYGLRAEAYRIKIVKKGEAAPGSTTRPSVKKELSYRAHVAQIGWQNWTADNTVAGTVGQSLQMEAFEMKLVNPEVSGSVQYQTHIQDIGWESGWKSDGQTSGTTGQGKRIEAIRIRLTDQMDKKYDIYYRVQSQDYGWLGWAKNGNEAGTVGQAKRAEAIEVKLVNKEDEAPGSTDNAFVGKENAFSLDHIFQIFQFNN